MKVGLRYSYVRLLRSLGVRLSYALHLKSRRVIFKHPFDRCIAAEVAPRRKDPLHFKSLLAKYT